MLRHAVVLSAAVLLLGCDSTEPSPIAGTWVATEFTITESGEETDVLAAGGALTITISSTNTTSGSLTIPASVTGEEEFTASMAGTATITGSTVDFEQAADSFVRDATWTIVGNTLVTTSTFAGVALDITLTRQ